MAFDAHGCPPLDSQPFFLFDAPFNLTHIAPNPDIAGTGVVVAFSASAYMTLFLVLIFYGSGCIKNFGRNGIDRGSVRVLQRLSRTRLRSTTVWKVCNEQLPPTFQSRF